MRAEKSQIKSIIIINRFFFPDYAGSSQTLSDLAFHFASKGWTVTALCSRRLSHDLGRLLPASEDVNGVSIVRIWAAPFGRHWIVGRAINYLAFYVGTFFHLFMKANPGTVILADTDPPLISVVAACFTKIRRVILVHRVADIYPEIAERLNVLPPEGILAETIRRARDFALNRSDAVVVLGHSMAEYIMGLGIDPIRIRTISNWADGDIIKPLTPGQNELRRRWNTENNFVIGYSGNMGRAHEFDALLDAGNLLIDEKEIRFLFIGDGAQRVRLEKQVRARHLKNIMFKAFQPSDFICDTLNVPDVHVVSLKPELEGLLFPGKFFGILAAGRPTIFIGSKEGEIARIVQENDCGYWVGSRDQTTLASCILALKNDRALCVRFGTNARRLFERSYDRSIALSKWEQVLFDAVKEHSTAPGLRER